MPKPKYITKVLNDTSVGKKFNRLTVISVISKPIGITSINKARYFECICECGNYTTIKKHDVINGKTKSCGCFQKEWALLEGDEAPFREVINRYKQTARIKNLEFDLSKEIFRKLFNSNCYYCGGEPSNVKTSWTGITFIYNGIDRIDSSKGYVKNNVVSCCKICNYAKRDMSQLEFMEWINRIIKFNGK